MGYKGEEMTTTLSPDYCGLLTFTDRDITPMSPEIGMDHFRVWTPIHSSIPARVKKVHTRTGIESVAVTGFDPFKLLGDQEEIETPYNPIPSRKVIPIDLKCELMGKGTPTSYQF
jgi:hypothetical protein